jgi:cytochrome c oxidase subunit II
VIATMRRMEVLATIALSASSCSFGMRGGASEQGGDTFDLWKVFVWAAIGVAAIVYGLIGWSLLRYRRRGTDQPDELGRQFRANVPLEIAYTAIPVVIVVALFAISVRTGNRVTSVSPDPDVTLHVDAYSWGWRFSFPDQGVTVLSEPSGEGVPGPELLLPLGETVRVELTSSDVIHAFWVPDFLFKRDAIPGRTSEFDVTPTTTGTFHGACSEFCGLNHAYMTFTVKVVPPEEFRSWLSDQQGEGQA